jgi:hypothetical protein
MGVCYFGASILSSYGDSMLHDIGHSPNIPNLTNDADYNSHRILGILTANMTTIFFPFAFAFLNIE